MSHSEKKRIEFLGLVREYRRYKREYSEIMDKVFSHGRVLQGKEVKDFEERVASFCERRHAVAVNSCTDALYFSLLVSGIGPSDKVLVTDFSYTASASCILRVGAKPVFVDIDDNFLMDFANAETRITEKTKALIYVHLYGQMGYPSEVLGFAKRHNLILIEDAAQSFGASYQGIKAGSLGQASCLSFDPTKVIGAPGSGGALLTNDDEIANEVVKLRYHGKDNSGNFVTLGFNSQMPTFTAALLNAKINKNEEWLNRRRQIAQYYLDSLDNRYVLPYELDGSCHIYHKFVIIDRNRDILKKYLAERNIQTMIHYPKPLHMQQCFSMYSYNGYDYPNASKISREVLSIPIHPFLLDSEVEFIVEQLNRFKRRYK